MPRDLLDWHLVDDATWAAQIERARHHHATRRWTKAAAGRSLGLLFFNPSLRTRTSMELAAAQLGAHASTITPGQGTWGFAWEDGAVMDGAEAEHIREAVGVLSRYYDALGVRLFASMTDYAADRDEQRLHLIADVAGVPVVNLESAFYHPCQALADAATLHTLFDGAVERRRFVLSWAYHPRPLPMAVPNSALLMAARLGMDVVVACPDAHRLDPGVVERAQAYAAVHGGSVETTSDAPTAYDGADVVYAKAWGGPLAYRHPDEEAEIRAAHRTWRVTADLMARTREAAFMHCLPVRRGVVVDDAVLDGPQARHLLQAEYRLHAQKAILEYVWDLH